MMNRTAAMFAAALGLIALIQSCTDNKTTIINRTNAIYTNIKLIVTDPDVSAMISEDAMRNLAEAERVYLEAVQVLENADLDSESGKNALGIIVDCADTILVVIDALDVMEQYEPVITAARLSVKLLRTNISAI
ncbi:hypothetical protein [Desulfobacter sp.]|uniref:hypothetical protein n=1 Tax=Desulfobacter sp. TaxID=2294 RepID=UPI003D144AA5